MDPVYALTKSETDSRDSIDEFLILKKKIEFELVMKFIDGLYIGNMDNFRNYFDRIMKLKLHNIMNEQFIGTFSRISNKNIHNMEYLDVEQLIKKREFIVKEIEELTCLKILFNQRSALSGLFEDLYNIRWYAKLNFSSFEKYEDYIKKIDDLIGPEGPENYNELGPNMNKSKLD